MGIGEVASHNMAVMCFLVHGGNSIIYRVSCWLKFSFG